MRSSLAALLLAATVAVGVAAYAVGAGTSSNDVTLCAVKKSGALSLASHGKCGKGTKKLTIAKEGPRGPVGSVGPAGAQGPQGSAGADGAAGGAGALEAVHYVTSPATVSCQTNPGTFCRPSNLSGAWEDFVDIFGGNRERMGYYKDGSGLVHLLGAAEWTSSGGTSGGFVPEGPFYLPPGFRPAHVLSFAIPSGYAEEINQTLTIEVRPDGLVAGAETWTPVVLDGISFRAS